MNTVTKQGINRTYTLNYGSGPNGNAGGAKLTVENEKTGTTRSLAAFGATNGEQSVGGVAYSGPNAQGAVVGVKGPNGSITAGAAQGPENAGYRIATRDSGGELKNVWKGYL